MTPLHCDGCARLIGFSVKGRVPTVVCTDKFCGLQSPATPNEARDDAVFLLAKLGRHPREIGELLGVSRQRVLQIVSARG